MFVLLKKENDKDVFEKVFWNHTSLFIYLFIYFL